MGSELARALETAIARSVDGGSAIAFSGGLDSALIATVARRSLKGVPLYTMGLRGSPDMERAGEVAAELGLPLVRVALDEEAIAQHAKTCFGLMPGGLMQVELMLGAYAIAQAAARDGRRSLLFGSGAEELFVGYQRHMDALARGRDVEAMLREELERLPAGDLARTRAVCAHGGVEARFPLLDPAVAAAAGRFSVAEKVGPDKVKKWLLREAAGELGVPDSARLRPKKAMQYGSSIHRIAFKLSRRGLIPILPEDRAVEHPED